MGKERFILSIDQGTTSSRAVLYNDMAEQVCCCFKEFEQLYPNRGWVSHRPTDIYNSVKEVIANVLEESQTSIEDISAIGITNQRESTIVFDRNTLEPIGDVIVWQCRRTSDICQEIAKKGYSDLIYDKTGLVLDAYFSATKIKWLLDNTPNARERAERGELCFGTIDTYLMAKLSKGKIFATDYSNASRTMLFNIHTLSWDEELCKLFDIPLSMLPAVYPSSHYYGKTDKDEIGKAIEIHSVAGDQQSSLYGQLCTKKAETKVTYGTGCFLLMNTEYTPVRSKRGLVTSLGASGGKKPHYVLEGSVFTGGSAIKWLKEELELIKTSSESENIALSVKDTNGVYVVPAFTGLGAPHWDSEARGIIAGLTRGANKAHIVRATLESIAYQVFDVIHAMERDTDITIDSLNVDGGASANNFLMQFQSDISSKVVVRPSNIETTSLGVALLAGQSIGFYGSIEELKKIKEKNQKSFSCTYSTKKQSDLIMGWGEAVLRTKAR